MSNDNKPIGWNTSPPVELPLSEVQAKLKTRTSKVSLNTASFDDLILQQGVRVKVYRTVLCPNVKSIDGGEHNFDCTMCRNEFIDKRPIKTWAFIQAQDLDKKPLPEGYYDANTVQATFLQGVEIQYFTLVELTDFTDIFYERVKRAEGNTDVLKYKAKKVNLLIDKSGKEFHVGNDFQIDTNGNIRWLLDRDPLKGTIYSIHYEAAVQFRAIKAMHANRFAQDNLTDKSKIIMTKMNEQWMLQKEFLVSRGDSPGDPLSPNKIRNSDED